MIRRTLLALLTFAVVLAAGVLALFALDLSRFSGAVAARIEEAVGRPVELDSLDLAWSGGPALHLGGFSVGDGFRADGLTLVADPWELLRGKAVFREVVVEGPEVVWRPRGAGASASLSVLRGALRQVEAVAVRDGSVVVQPPEPRSSPIEFRAFSGKASRADSGVRVEASGRLVQEDGDARVKLAGTLPLDRPLPWWDATLEAEASLDDLAPSSLLPSLGLAPATRGTASATLRVRGSPPGGLTFSLEVQGDGLAVVTAGGAALPVERLRASGEWLGKEAATRFRDLAVEVDGASARVQVTPLPGEAGSFRVQVEEARLPLAPAKALIPVRLPEETALWVDGGTASGSFASALRLELEGRLAAGDFQFPFGVSGTVKPAGDPPGIDLSVEGTASADGIPGVEALPLAASGPVEVAIGIRGPAFEPGIEVQVDFSAVELSWQDRFRKRSGARGALSGAVSRTADGIELAGLRLLAGPLELRGSASWSPASGFSLDWQLPPLEVADAAALLPFLAKAAPRGTLEARGTAAGAGWALTSLDGEARLRGVGFRLGGPFADVVDLQGSAGLALDRVELRDLTGRLGSSPVEAEGRIHLAGPALELSARADEVRPDDLFFPAESPILTDVRADLRFDRSGTEIRDARLSLPGGTRAAVKGEVRGYRKPSIDLAVEAETARLEEVAALFRGLRTGRGDGGPVRVEFRARDGGWGGFAFGDLAGTLTYRDRTLELAKVAFRPPEPLGAVREASARIRFAEGRLRLSEVEGLLGSSRVRAEGTVEGEDPPEVRLTVRSPELRASDLFSASDALFRDVEGTLLGSPGRLRLEEVNAVLGSSRFVLRGEVTGGRPVRADLRVESPSAHLEDALRLFGGVYGRGGADSPVSVRAALQAEEGTLGPVPFQNFEGRASYEGRVLRLTAVRFTPGSGTCEGTARMERGNGATALSLEGIAKGVDAELLHRTLLGDRGLVTGTLEGSFRISGEGTGEAFWSSSTGEAELRVADGVLRKFPILAKIFSLLNISQIFRFRLPDMAREGIPFERVEGSFNLANGVLSTEDLHMESDAMGLSAVGSADLAASTVDAAVAVRPLQTVDTLVSKLPLAGWILGGEDESVVSAHFRVTGSLDDPKVDPIPLSALSDGVRGIFRRVLGLPGQAVEGLGGLLPDAETPQARPPP